MGLLRSLTRLYTFYTPIKRGSYRLAEASLRFGGDLPERLMIDTADGCKMILNPADHGYKFTYFLGEYEPAVTHCIRGSVRPGDVCLDIGANAGWFTTLLMKLAGKSGSVHSFEPVPATFERLCENIELNKELGTCIANDFALGDKIGEIEMVLESGVPDGHASVSTSQEEIVRSGVAVAGVKTLDSYLSENAVGSVDFLKADIEGSELSMLKGASKLFQQEIPPVMEIEMALATSKRFGYIPNDLIVFINKRRPFDFYEISEHGRRLVKIEGFDDDSIGANVLCIPKGERNDCRVNLGI